jgi:hypothetical protein
MKVALDGLAARGAPASGARLPLSGGREPGRNPLADDAGVAGVRLSLRQPTNPEEPIELLGAQLDRDDDPALLDALPVPPIADAGELAAPDRLGTELRPGKYTCPWPGRRRWRLPWRAFKHRGYLRFPPLSRAQPDRHDPLRESPGSVRLNPPRIREL